MQLPPRSNHSHIFTWDAETKSSDNSSYTSVSSYCLWIVRWPRIMLIANSWQARDLITQKYGRILPDSIMVASRPVAYHIYQWLLHWTENLFIELAIWNTTSHVLRYAAPEIQSPRTIKWEVRDWGPRLVQEYEDTRLPAVSGDYTLLSFGWELEFNFRLQEAKCQVGSQRLAI